MSKEQYLQIKKEYRIRLFLIFCLFILFSILYCMLLFSSSRYIPFFSASIVTLGSINQFLIVPFLKQKKSIEEEHPDWKELSPKGVKLPSKEATQRTLAGIGATFILLLTFAMFYRPVQQQDINVREFNDRPKINFDSSTPTTSTTSSESSSSDSSSTEQSSTGTEEEQTNQSNSDTGSSYPHIYGTDDEVVKKVIDKSVQDLKEKQSGEQSGN